MPAEKACDDFLRHRPAVATELAVATEIGGRTMIDASEPSMTMQQISGLATFRPYCCGH
jgi:hypothetical protein